MRADRWIDRAVCGIVPFLCADFVKLALLIAVPAIALWLPGTMR